MTSDEFVKIAIIVLAACHVLLVVSILSVLYRIKKFTTRVTTSFATAKYGYKIMRNKAMQAYAPLQNVSHFVQKSRGGHKKQDA